MLDSLGGWGLATFHSPPLPTVPTPLSPTLVTLARRATHVALVAPMLPGQVT